MKKITLITSMMVMGFGTAFSQLARTSTHVGKNNVSNNLIAQKPALPNSGNATHRHGNGQNHTAAIIWQDDFSNASLWSITHDIGTNDWVIGTNGPSGQYLIDPIASTTATNGFALFDSDLMCDMVNGQIGNLTTVNPINCTGFNSVRLSFQEYYRRFVDSTYIYVSNDGTTWTLFNSANANVVPNDFCGGGQAGGVNPTTIHIDVSSVAANQDSVYIRFTFYSPPSMGAGFGCSYSWMVDDVVLAEPPADDVAMVWGFPSQYTIIPISQVLPIDVNGRVTNVGGQTESSVGFNATIYHFQGGTQVGIPFDGPSATTTLNVGDTSALLSAGMWTPVDTGVYLFVLHSIMTNVDGDMTNDTLFEYLVISDTSYARDYAAITGQVDNQVGFNGATGYLGNMFDINQATIIKTVSTFFVSRSIGDTITLDIFDVAAGLPSNVLASSGPYILTAADTGGAFITLPLDIPVAAPVGQIFAAIQQVDTNNIGVGFNNDVFTPLSCFFQVAGGAWTPTESVFSGAFLVRPNIDAATGITSVPTGKNIDIFPNPANNILYIRNNNKNTSDYTVNILDAIGKVVYTKMYSTLVNASVDISKLANGVYTVQFKSAAEVSTKAIVVSNK